MDRQKEFVLRTLEERDIRFVRLWFTDVLGYLKSVAIAPAELEGAFEEGIGFDGSSIEGFARVSESDTVARPDPSTFQVLPWTTSRGDHHSARMFCDITMPDGSPSWADSRHVLRRQLAKASDLGFSCYVHPEIEFFLLKPGPDDGSVPVPADNGGYFDQAVHDAAPNFRRRHRCAGTDGHLGGVQPPRGAPGQQEIDLRYADALSMADNVMTFRYVVVEVALGDGVRASFMPKPFAEYPGSAMHTHMSLFEGDQRLPHSRRPAAALRRRQGVHRRHSRARVGDKRRHQPVGELLQAAGARRRRPRRGVRPTARHWCGCRCTPRARRRRGASKCAVPTRHATRI